MSFIKCAACPTPADCAEEDRCLNLFVTRSHCGARILSTTGAAPLMCGQGYSGATAPAATAPAAQAPQGSQRPPRPAGEPTQRPATGTTTGRVWAIADKLRQEQIDYGSRDFRRNVISACEAGGINKSTASVQFSKWLSSQS